MLTLVKSFSIIICDLYPVNLQVSKLLIIMESDK